MHYILPAAMRALSKATAEYLSTLSLMPLEEACKILDVSSSASAKEIQDRAEYLASINRGSSQYLQTKIKSARRSLEAANK